MALDERGFQKLFRTDLATLGGVKLAEEIGVSTQHISDVRTGYRRPGPKVLAYYGLEKVVKVVRVVTYIPAAKK